MNASDSTMGRKISHGICHKIELFMGNNQTKILEFKYLQKYLVTLFPLPFIFLALCLFSHDWDLHNTVMFSSDMASSVLITLFWLYF